MRLRLTLTKSETNPPYKLKFHPDALEEWRRLDGSVKNIFRRLLKKKLTNPHSPGSALHGELKYCYKIKLRKQGYRLVYYVEDEQLVVIVIAIDKREELAAYKSALARLPKTD